MKENFQNFTVLGYYICSIMDTPNYLSGISAKMISASECLCDHQPQLHLCAGWKPQGDNEDYRKKWHLTSDEYQMMSTKINRLFEEKLFYSDGRFIRKEDAVSFYKTYFYCPETILICLKTDKKNVSKLDSEFTCIQEENGISSSQELIGYDIIGWDMGGFHSFLCNSLNKEFNNLKFTSLGLLEMNYQEVERIAQMIQGKGEPVDWIPCKLEKVELK